MNNTDSLQGPQMFQMPNQGAAANQAFGQIGGLNQFGNLGSGVLPQAQQTSQNLYNNPFASQGLAGAQGASQLGQAGALTGFNQGSNLVGQGNSLVPYAQQTMQTGFDPQQQLYNRTLQQVQDQTRAGEASRGIQTTPYGAGLENDATRNFNIDWQNNQLGRQQTAAGTAEGLLGTGQNLTTGGVNMMNAAPGQLVQSAMLPYATYSDIGQGQFGALSQLLGIGGQGQSLANMPIQDLLQYLGVGNQAGSVANQNFSNQLAQAKQSFSQDQSFAQGIGSILGFSPGGQGGQTVAGMGLGLLGL